MTAAAFDFRILQSSLLKPLIQMSGYSGTPLPKKLGIKPGLRVHLANAPADIRCELGDSLAGCTPAKESDEIDFSMFFTKSRAELAKQFPRLSRLLAPAGMLWISWPKKSSGASTDLTENDVRNIGLQAGLVDVKVCAVTNVWSGLKFVRRIKDRKSRT